MRNRCTARLRAASCCVAVLLPGAAAFAGPADIVPRGSIAYDLMGSLASGGSLPGLSLRDFFRGDRLYTRAEFADFVRRLRRGLTEDSARANILPADSTALLALETEFAAELGGIALPRGDRPVAVRVTGAFKARALTDPDAGSGIGRVSVILPVGRDGYAALAGGNFRNEWYDESAPRKGGYPLIETAFIRVNGRALDVSVGRMPLRWGPGYVGGMLLSDDSPSLPQIRVEKIFRLPGTLGRRVGPLRFEQFDAQFFEDDIPGALPDARGTRRYLLGRRIETNGEGRFSFSAGEAFKSTRLPDPIFANLLPFFVYQNSWTESSRRRTFAFLASGALPDTGWLNYLADINLSYRADARRTSLYADLLLDDVQAPDGFNLGNPTPRKIGGQVGVYAPDLGGLGGKVALRLEFATIDAGTYANASLPVAYDQNGVSLGHPSGPNAEVYFGRLDVAATSKLKLALEGTLRRRKDRSEPAPKTDRLGLYATYALRRGAFVGARFEHLQTENGAVTASSDRAELNLGIGF
ncbi:MAG: hypothetical protein H7Z41_05380 [Cytophagales bacterium]|nr:hypothetical protein [Armatimonadota bacterium]